MEAMGAPIVSELASDAKPSASTDANYTFVANGQNIAVVKVVPVRLLTMQ